jgi:hypothetical protein
MPILCIRLDIARLANRFSTHSAEKSHCEPGFAETIEEIYNSVVALKMTIPQDWNPDGDIFADPEVHQCVLVMHYEYHALSLAIYTVVALAPFRKVDCFTPAMAVQRDQAVGRIRNSRRLLSTLVAMDQAKLHNRALTQWCVGLRLLKSGLTWIGCSMCRSWAPFSIYIRMSSTVRTPSRQRQIYRCW